MLAVTTTVSASPSLRKLDIQVDLRDNGDAEIIETRQMSIDSEGTECYIVIDNLNGRDITDFYVTDETGKKYTNVGDWKVKQSREWKTGKCGIVRKSNGYELCWGLGQSGERIYIAHYVVTNLVLSYKESDGFNWMFVTREMSPSPQLVEINIQASCLNNGLPEDSINIWLFGNRNGNIEMLDNSVEAKVTSMESDESVIVLLELQKGLLHPAKSDNRTFKEVRKNAFEGSDYNVESVLKKAWNYIKTNIRFIFGGLFLLLFVAFMIYDAYFTLNKKEWIEQDNQDYRNSVELRFKEYFKEFNYLYESISEDVKNQIIVGLKNRMFNEGLIMEQITFDDWIKHIKEL